MSQSGNRKAGRVEGDDCGWQRGEGEQCSESVPGTPGVGEEGKEPAAVGAWWLAQVRHPSFPAKKQPEMHPPMTRASFLRTGGPIPLV
jgi:hypothetical protein